jgi:hypothetical protein
MRGLASGREQNAEQAIHHSHLPVSLPPKDPPLLTNTHATSLRLLTQSLVWVAIASQPLPQACPFHTPLVQHGLLTTHYGVGVCTIVFTMSSHKQIH